MLLGWSGKGGIFIWRNGVIKEDRLIEFCQFRSWHIHVATLFLFYHTPELFRLLFEHLWELKLHVRSAHLAGLYKRF